ncbi:hypothetical protein COLO4_20582 [Corchorus olitorius]|uniref:Uncharacterized protein n=1 Tax=Corchorus olitorius TaxID=93759 RepID=A0A1R3IYX6_9ROSI|nr:hypothetical protein COLO4_20582 [Corchorus olitorius]
MNGSLVLLFSFWQETLLVHKDLVQSGLLNELIVDLLVEGTLQATSLNMMLTNIHDCHVLEEDVIRGCWCREAMIPCILLALGGNLVDGPGPGNSRIGLRTLVAIIFGRLCLVPPAGLGSVTLADKIGFLPPDDKMFRHCHLRR